LLGSPISTLPPPTLDLSLETWIARASNAAPLRMRSVKFAAGRDDGWLAVATVGHCQITRMTSCPGSAARCVRVGVGSRICGRWEQCFDGC
jgi:hypothetical protein